MQPNMNCSRPAMKRKRGGANSNGGGGAASGSNTPEQYLPTDMFLKCGDRIWPVHRRILVIHSPFLRRYYRKFGEMRDAPPVDGQVVSAVHAALRFMYTGDYDDEDYDLEEYKNAEDAYPILFNVYVHAVAAKLEIVELEELAVNKFSQRAEAECESPGFADAVREIYTVCPESRIALKNKVVEVCRDHAIQLFGVGAGVGSDFRLWYHKLHKVLDEVPQFRRDILLAAPPTAEDMDSVLTLSTEEVSYLCPHCDETFVIRSMSVRQKKHCWCPYCGAQEVTANLKRQEVKFKQEAFEPGGVPDIRVEKAWEW